MKLTNSSHVTCTQIIIINFQKSTNFKFFIRISTAPLFVDFGVFLPHKKTKFCNLTIKFTTVAFFAIYSYFFFSRERTFLARKKSEIKIENFFFSRERNFFSQKKVTKHSRTPIQNFTLSLNPGNLNFCYLSTIAYKNRK